MALRRFIDGTHAAETSGVEYQQPAAQRHVLEIRLPEPDTSQLQTETGTKVRWIVFAPKDSMANAPDLPALHRTSAARFRRGPHGAKAIRNRPPPPAIPPSWFPANDGG